MKTNVFKSKAYKILEKIQNSIGGNLRISKKGVPHLVLDGYYSICYFFLQNKFKIFEEYATPENRKICELKLYTDVINFFNNIKEKK